MTKKERFSKYKIAMALAVIGILVFILIFIIKNIESITGNVIEEDQEVEEYVIILEDKPAIERVYGKDKEIKNDKVNEMRKEKQKIKEKQDKIINEIKKKTNKKRVLEDPENVIGKPESKDDLVILVRDQDAVNLITAYLTESEAKKVEKIIGVKYVYKAPKFSIALSESLNIIKAPNVWVSKDTSGLNYLKGTGTTIAVIDTGVDYTHPMLGGCKDYSTFLQGRCKVKGGYDIENIDKNPMDDNGHGTHVASIAAGKAIQIVNTQTGEIKTISGVAPDANILAYKVLNAQGESSGGSGKVFSNIIWALKNIRDPNGDSDYSDRKADVIVMSIGSSCETYSRFCGPDDDLSREVDATYDAGIIVVVAAGNCGPNGDRDNCVRLGEETIESPGTAKKAITVGATDDSDNIADFSSRGPVIWGSNIMLKPDVVAPGKSILAAYPKSIKPTEYETLSGTSQAAPHVAGIALLVKQYHPDWSNDRIKAVIVSPTAELPLPITQQGYGRVNAYNSVFFKGIPGTALLYTNLIINGADANGRINVRGTATGTITSFSNYYLYYGPGNTAPSWIPLKGSTTRVVDGGIYKGFELTKLPDGYSYFKLIVRNIKKGDVKNIAIVKLCRTC